MIDYESLFKIEVGDIKDTIRNAKMNLERIKHYQQLHNAETSTVSKLTF